MHNTPLHNNISRASLRHSRLTINWLAILDAERLGLWCQEAEST